MGHKARFCTISCKMLLFVPLLQFVVGTDVLDSEEYDEYTWQYYTLDNGLQVYLLREEDNADSGASLSVGVGAGSDPKDLTGMAHFVEHGLFLGSSNYPEEDNLKHFVEANGGKVQGTTSYDETAYSFTVMSSSLPEALERFADMFISPIFRKSSLEKEIEALQSEYEIYIHEEDNVDRLVRRLTSNRQHPFSRLISGNRENLWTTPSAIGRNISAELMEFFYKYYCSENMRLVVQGPQSMRELEKLVEQSFTNINPGNAHIPISDISPYGKNEVQRWIFIVPNSDIDQMIISFALPITFYERNTEAQYVSSLITQKSKGSLRYCLRSYELARNVVSGYRKNRNFYTIDFTLHMDKEGIEAKEEVISIFYCYINLIKDKGAQEWYWKERKLLQRISSKYDVKTDLMDSLKRLSSDMLWSDIETWESIYSNDRNLSSSTVARILSMMAPENIRVTIISKEYQKKAKRTETLSGVKYTTKKINAETLQEWTTDLECSEIYETLEFPSPNPYIPKQFKIKSVVDDAGDKPTLLKDSPLSKIWFLQDNEFFTPKAIISLKVLNSQASIDPLSFMLTKIICTHEHLVFDEGYYYPSLLDFVYKVYPTIDGLKLELSGYDETLPMVLNRTFRSLVSWNIPHDEHSWIDSIKDSLKKAYTDGKLHQPHQRASRYVRAILTENVYTEADLLPVIDDISLPFLLRQKEMLFSRMKLEWVFYGNLIPSEALQIAKELEMFWNTTWKPRPLSSLRDSSGQLEIPPGCNLLYQLITTSNINSAVVLVYQLGMRKDKRDHAFLTLLEQIISSSFYNQLRLQETLGYIAGAYIQTDKPAPQIVFRVQSNRHPAFLYSRIQAFLRSVSRNLDMLSNEEYEKQRETCLSVLKMNRPKNQRERFNQLFDYEKESQYGQAINNLTLQGFRDLFRKSFLEDGASRKSLLVTVTSHAKNGAGRHLRKIDKQLLTKLKSTRKSITDILEWKKQQNVFLNL